MAERELVFRVLKMNGHTVVELVIRDKRKKEGKFIRRNQA